MKKTLPILFGLIMLCLNCQRQASTLFQQSAEIARQIAPTVENLEQEKNNISIQGRALSEAEIRKIDQIDALLNRYDWFKKNHQASNKFKEQKACLETIQWIQNQLAALQ